MGFALYTAQSGGRHDRTRPLRGFQGAGVIEVVQDHDGDAYRVVHTVRFRDAVYVLHAFQKRSKRGVATPRRDIEIVKSRLELARQLHAQRVARTQGDTP